MEQKYPIAAVGYRLQVIWDGACLYRLKWESIEKEKTFFRSALPKWLITLVGELEGYFQEKKAITSIPWEYLELSTWNLKEKRILEATSQIPYGQTRSYRWVAQKSGIDGASQWVGKVLAKNPFPVLIPCHRVVRTTGALGGYIGKKSAVFLELKKRLLSLESLGVQPVFSFLEKDFIPWSNSALNV